MRGNNWKFFIRICAFILFVSFATLSCSQNSTIETHQIEKTALESQGFENNDAANYEIISTDNAHNPFSLFARAFEKSKTHLKTSLLFLLFLWVILSLILYLFEHHAQPDAYRNFGVSFLWTFVKSISDPGEMAPNRPITLVGKTVANIIGILAIIIVAVPTGILSSAFVNVMDEEAQKEQTITNIERIHKSFRWTQRSGLYMIPVFKPLDNYLTIQNLSSDDVVEAVRHSPELHLYNLAKAYDEEDEPIDRIVVVPCPHNRPYGYCIDRGSNVTIVSTSGNDEPITSWVAYHIAKIGGFNYVAKELEQNVDEPKSYWKFDDEDIDENLHLFLDDINRIASRPDSWVIPMAFNKGPKSREHKFHLVYSYNKGEQGYDVSSITVRDTTTFEQLFEDLNATMTSDFDAPCDKNIYYTVPDNTIAKRLKSKNVFFFRAECQVIYFSSKKCDMIKMIADVFNRHLEPEVKKTIPQEMLKKPKGAYGYRYYTN